MTHVCSHPRYGHPVKERVQQAADQMTEGGPAEAGQHARSRGFTLYACKRDKCKASSYKLKTEQYDHGEADGKYERSDKAERCLVGGLIGEGCREGKNCAT
ncbi:hypothetical protein D3C78_963080 [compost metagenome]